MTTYRAILGLAGAVAICFAAAGIGGLFTASSVGTWYQSIRKPTWTPPAWLFGPAWTTLYVLMAVAAWLVWRERGFSGAATALGLFGLQLALNAAWSGLFFGLRNPGAAFAELVVLWLAILATLLSFWPISKVAGVLLVPYLGWVSFAGALNYAVWRMNPPS
jgi:translocator protein